MRRAWLVVRSSLLWTAGVVHFVVVGTLVLLAGALVGRRRADPLLRWGCRNVVRLTGARLKTTASPDYDPRRTCFFVANHVNIFDPFVLSTAIGRRVCGLELESYFRLPFYGWLMRRFGNVPVPDDRDPSGLKRTYRLARRAIEEGISLIVMPEGSRTLDGRVGAFEEGAFRMARTLRVPVVPVSQVGAFTLHRKGGRMLFPATVEVVLHAPVSLEGLARKDLPALVERVREIVAAPVHASLERQ